MALRIAAVAIVILLALAAGGFLSRVAAEPPGPLEPEDFGRSVRQVASLARETAFLCEQIRDDRLTGAFARTHRSKLEDELRDPAENLEAPVPPALADAGSQARELAQALATQLRELKLHLAEPQALERVHDEALRIADAVQRLEPR
jgi:hypothetical protein